MQIPTIPKWWVRADVSCGCQVMPRCPKLVLGYRKCRVVPRTWWHRCRTRTQGTAVRLRWGCWGVVWAWRREPEGDVCLLSAPRGPKHTTYWLGPRLCQPFCQHGFLDPARKGNGLLAMFPRYLLRSHRRRNLVGS